MYNILTISYVINCIIYRLYYHILILNNVILTRLKLFEYRKFRKCSRKESINQN